MGKEQAMIFLEEKGVRCPECGLKMSRGKDGFNCIVCHICLKLTQSKSKTQSGEKK